MAARPAGDRDGRRRPPRAGLLALAVAAALTATTVAAVTAWGRTAATGLPAVESQSLTVTTADGSVFGRTTARWTSGSASRTPRRRPVSPTARIR